AETCFEQSRNRQITRDSLRRLERQTTYRTRWWATGWAKGVERPTFLYVGWTARCLLAVRETSQHVDKGGSLRLLAALRAAPAIDPELPSSATMKGFRPAAREGVGDARREEWQPGSGCSLLVLLVPDPDLPGLRGPRGPGHPGVSRRRGRGALDALDVLTPGAVEDQREADGGGEPPLQRVGQVRPLTGVGLLEPLWSHDLFAV